MELLHDGWPVHEGQLRMMVGDDQVEQWLADGVLRYGDPTPLPSSRDTAVRQGPSPFQASHKDDS